MGQLRITGGVTGGGNVIFTDLFNTYLINYSLDVEASNSAYVTRTFPSIGNRKTWSLSFWIKRETISTIQQVFYAHYSGSAGMGLGFETNNKFRLVDTRSSTLYTNSYSDLTIADTTTWHHVLLAYDTTEAATVDRVKGWIDNNQITWSGGQPSLNFDGLVNLNILHLLFRNPNIGANIDGKVAEINFLDGIAATPTDFGMVSGANWIPVEYTGSYGSNGFYLDFADNTTAADLGNDVSGNGNDFTPTNFVTGDQSTDTPTS